MAGTTSRFRPIVWLVGLVAVLAAAPRAGAQLQPPNAPIGGLSQAELSVGWRQWLISYPNGGNPANDGTTGALAHRGADQTPATHPGAFFLAGNFGTPSTRSVTVGSNDTLFFPLITTVSPIGFHGSTEAEVRAAGVTELGAVSNLSVRLGGVDLPLPASTTSLLDFQQHSPPALFDLVLPPDNAYGAPDGTYQSVSTGYFVALGPLAPGSYTLDFGATAAGTPPDFPGFSQQQS